MKYFLLLSSFVFSLISVVSSNSTRCWGKCDDPQFTYDQDLCRCVRELTTNEPCAIRCMSGYRLAYLNGKCFCEKIECEAWQMIDEEQRKCVCKYSWNCSNGEVWDDYYCKCFDAPSSLDSTPSPLCAITCPSDNFTTNYEKCRCDCNIHSCPTGQQLDHQLCRCEGCQKQCPEGYVLSQQNCSCWDCECRSVSSPSSSDCNPQNIKCHDGMIFDELICKCVLDSKPMCPSGYKYDEAACDCICNSYEECRDNFVWNENTCSCVCPLGEVCGIGFIFDRNVCGCVCDSNITCSEGFILNEYTCNCACIQTEKCFDGFIWDELTCKCVKDMKPNCGPGFYYNSDHCECMCEVIFFCEKYKVFDDKICQCVCPKQIDCHGGYLNVDSCKCENVPSW